MATRLRVVHYINQFFGGIGGEEQAGAPVEERSGPVGPGLALAAEFGDQAEIVATVLCGDNRFHEETAAVTQEIVERIAARRPHVVVAGPAFGAGRYGVACGAVCAAVEERLGLPAVTAMYQENPGVDLYGARVMVVPTSDSATSMRQAVPALARLALRRAAGKSLGPAEEEGYLPRGIHKNGFVAETGARRMVSMLLKRLNGETFQTEISLPTFVPVVPAPPVPDIARALVALVTESGVVPAGNPDRLESLRATKWVSYNIARLDDFHRGEFASVHGGFDTTEIDRDPDRVLPLDVLRDLEREGKIGKLYETMYVTCGNGAPIARCEQFGREIARELAGAGVQAAILTAT